MYKKTKNIAATIGLGIAAGTVVAAIGSQVAKHNHHPGTAIKKSAEKAVHTVGAVLDGVEKMLR